MQKTISIHQPNFIPRLNYFEKIAKSDVFVILSHCQFEKGGFQNRFNVADRFYGMAVNQGTQLISDKLYKNHERDWKKITDNFPCLCVFDSLINKYVHFTNSVIIRSACLIMGIKTEITNDHPTNLTGTARLVDLCKTHGATKYLSGISGRNYLDLSLFEQAEIEVEFQNEKTMDRRPLVEVL